MPVLNWVGKEYIVNHDKEIPFRLLKNNKSRSISSSKNLIIEGDNLEALKALFPYYESKIKCIFIDPPYNTGNEKWIYNDNVNAPKIKNWIGKVVGPETEDLNRHDKWLCMMYPRLKLLRDLLTKDGSIFVSIDDNEYAHLKQIMDEIFGRENFLGSIVWQKNFSPHNDAKTFSPSHDFILSYAKNRKEWETKGRNLLPRTEKQNQRYSNPDNDPRGVWTSGGIDVKTYSKDYDYPITTPSGRVVNPPGGSCWRFSPEEFQRRVKDNRIWFGNDGNNVPRIKRFLSEVQAGIVPVTLWTRDEVGDTQEARREVSEILNGNNEFFETPKPIRLIKRILEITTNDNDIILDSFSGTGTTGHAVLELNHEKNSNRNFILIELESKICQKITSERIKRVIKGFSNKGKKIEGLGGGFEYCLLEQPLFDIEGKINPDCSFQELASYIFFTETRSVLEPKSIKKNYIGTNNDVDFYLIFKGINDNLLNIEFLSKLKNDSKKIIYADKCTVSDSVLEQHNTVFKQIPYSIRIF